MLILAIDPSSEGNNGVVLYDPRDKSVIVSGIMADQDVKTLWPYDMQVHIEMPEGMGQAVGHHVMHTCRIAGRFQEYFEAQGFTVHLVSRRAVKLHLCGKMQGITDANVRRAVMDRFPRTGGGKTPEVGIKSKPGPLYGFANDMWAALAIAVYAAECKMGVFEKP